MAQSVARWLVGAFALYSSLVQARETDFLAIRNTSVIDVKAGVLRNNATVLIQGTRIAAVGRSNRLRIPKGATVVDGRGKFLIPGLWDMHVHFRGAMNGTPALVEENEALLPIYLANGVTGVREMGGDMVDLVLRWRAETERGDRLSPRIATCGPKLNGPSPLWPGSITISTPEEGRAAVRTVKALGADFVKVYDGLSAEALVAIVDEAKRQRLRVTGHPTGGRTMVEISTLGMDIEHVSPTLAIAAARDELSLRRPANGRALPMFSLDLARLVVEQFDHDAVKALAARFVENGTCLTPTLKARRATALAPDMSDVRRRYFAPRWLGTWDARAALDPAMFEHPTRRQEREVEERLVAELSRAGVVILAGSDAGSANQNLYPGFGLHDELTELARVGLQPAQILRAATLHAARWLGRDAEVGSIEKGMLADLVLLDSNPLDDIHNTSKIRMVITNGKLLQRRQLDQMLEAAAVAAK